MQNLELLKNYDITIQKQPTHTLSHFITLCHKTQKTLTPLRDVICEWSLYEYRNDLINPPGAHLSEMILRVGAFRVGLNQRESLLNLHALMSTTR